MRHRFVFIAATALAALVGCSDGSSRRLPETDNPPSVSDIGDTTAPANSAELRIDFSISDDQTDPAALMVSVESDSPGLFAGRGPVIEGSGSDREIVVTPAPGIVGMATITVTVTDAAGQSASTDFLLTVAPQQVGFASALRAAFDADENDEPQSVNDKEYSDDESNFDDLVRN